MKKYEVVVFDEVHKFIIESNEGLRSKLIRQLRYVEEFGISTVIPSLKKVIGTRFWELRVF